ncbi:MAG: hypothetical protein K0R94_745 [Burkholderiales bacterium]|jgi:hypothetical protein|nr:hypothetical protein [Burkholderiales bacterium]
MIKKNINLVKAASLLIALSLTLTACGGGGGSNSGGPNPPPPQGGNFTQITPNGGVQVPTNPQAATLNALPPSDYFTVMTMSNNGTLFAGTAYGAIYQITDANNGFSSMGTPIVNPDSRGNSIIALGANQNSYAYVTLSNPLTSQGTAGTTITAENTITAIALAANGTAYYGTLNSTIGVANSAHPITPFTSTTICLDSNKCPITALGLTSNNASSGKKGVAALQFSAESRPVFNAKLAESGSWATWFNSSVFCLTQNGSSSWVRASLNGIPPVEVESFAYTNESGIESVSTTVVPQFITAMVTSPTGDTSGNIYVGTNLFNVYVTSATEDNECGAGWTQVNNVALGKLQNGSVGITSLGLVNNQLIAVVNNSESVISAYKYNGSAK